MNPIDITLTLALTCFATLVIGALVKLIDLMF